MSSFGQLSSSQETLWAKYRNDKFLIVGFTERTGRSVARVFEGFGITYKVSDLRPRAELAPALAGLRLKKEDVFCGPQGPEQLAGVTKIILSPGVPRSIPLLLEAERRGLPVLGDVDFIYDFFKHKKIVAITGTDGKTTTTLLTGHLLGLLGQVVVAGNTGEAVFSRYDEILACDYLVLELSSFMLEDLRHFRPDIAAITNVAEDHLERYPCFRAYARAKLNLLRHCHPGDTFIKNLDDPALRLVRPEHLKVRTISQHDPSADYVHVGGGLRCRGEILAYADPLLRGAHNRENILVALAIACEAGVDPREAVGRIATFPPVPHRFSFLGRYGGVEVYDDSKATTVHAVDRALESLASPVVLIAGGRDKNLDFSPLARYGPKIRKLVCYGEAGERIQRSLGSVRSEYVFDFEGAVLKAVAFCCPGDSLLLSPGCTSWDQHRDYAARGQMFREIALAALEPGGGASASPRGFAGEAGREAPLRSTPLPSSFPEGNAFPGLRLACAHRAGTEVNRSAAELCAVFQTGTEKTLVLLGDLHGTGGLDDLAKAITESVRAFSAESTSLIVGQTGAALFRRLLGHKAVANLVAAIADARERTFTYSVAGSIAPLLMSELHAPFFLPGAGQYPLGVDPHATYRATRVRISSGTRLVLMTAGLTETHGGTRRFGERRIRLAARKHSLAGLDALPGRLIAELEGFAGGDLAESVTVLALQLAGSLGLEMPMRKAYQARLTQGVW